MSYCIIGVCFAVIVIWLISVECRMMHAETDIEILKDSIKKLRSKKQ